MKWGVSPRNSGVMIEATSSGSSSGSAGLVGWRDTASAAAWRIPGMWVSVNRYLSDYSLRLRNLGLGMSFRDLSPKTLSRGL